MTSVGLVVSLLKTAKKPPITIGKVLLSSLSAMVADDHIELSHASDLDGFLPCPRSYCRGAESLGGTFGRLFLAPDATRQPSERGPGALKSKLK